MIKKHCILFALFAYGFLCSQNTPDLGKSDSHEYFIEQLNTSKDEKFQRTVARYNAYIEQHPENIVAQIELCKFIGGSYWDAYEDYNLKYEETEACVSGLYASYPENPKVIIYRAESLYGEELEEVLNEAEVLITANKLEWNKEEIAEIYRMLANYHTDNNPLSLAYYKKAQSFNDSLDLSLHIAKAYALAGEKEKARATLIPDLEKDTLTWTLNQKADLLLELKAHEKALQLYDIIADKDSTYLNNGEMATAMSELGDLKTARAFLVKDTLQEWNKTEALQALFKFDLDHSDAKTALVTYRRLQNLDSNDDLLGIKRLTVFFKNPMLVWKLSELFHLFLFVLSLILIFLIPYLWVLPIHSLGHYLKSRNRAPVPKLNFNWNLKHFWFISFMILLVSYLVLIVFGYTENINYYLDVVVSYADDFEDEARLADEMLFFVVGMAISTLLVLRKTNIGHIWKRNQPFIKIVGLSIGLVLLNMIVLRVLSSFVDISSNDMSGIFFNAKPEILAMLNTYGFGIALLLVALIGPLYEEIIFRGVILGAAEKQIGFKGANIFQAVLFALIHANMGLFIFYFFFGILTGYLANRTKGLLAGIIYHCMNNLLVLIALYYASKLVV